MITEHYAGLKEVREEMYVAFGRQQRLLCRSELSWSVVRLFGICDERGESQQLADVVDVEKAVQSSVGEQSWSLVARVQWSVQIG
jgi:hypothetical protein